MAWEKILIKSIQNFKLQKNQDKETVTEEMK